MDSIIVGFKKLLTKAIFNRRVAFFYFTVNFLVQIDSVLVEALERSAYGFASFVGNLQKTSKVDLFLFKKERLQS